MSHRRAAHALERHPTVGGCRPARTSYGFALAKVPPPVQTRGGASAISLTIRLGSGFETRKRWSHHARADLTAASAGDADIEDRKHLVLHRLEIVDARGRAA